jgi:RNA polymerase sigma-70 factor (ECF subfamily)
MKATGQILWIKVKNGDLKAFELLYKSNFSALCLYAYGIVRDYEIVKEIVNDVFLKIWQKREELEIRYEIKSYLLRCVHNGCCNYLKSKSASGWSKLKEMNDNMEEIIGTNEDGLLEIMSYRDVEKDVTRSIEELPPQCREIFHLSRFDLFTYQEISEKLNISVNTVKTQISRALVQLRGSLRKYL